MKDPIAQEVLDELLQMVQTDLKTAKNFVEKHPELNLDIDLALFITGKEKEEGFFSQEVITEQDLRLHYIDLPAGVMENQVRVCLDAMAKCDNPKTLREITEALLATNEKEVLQKVLREVLQENEPETVEDFNIAFDDVYDALKQNFRKQPLADPVLEGQGIGFDAAVLAGTPITIVTAIGIALLEAVKKEPEGLDITARLDAAEKRVTQWSNRGPIVHQIRGRIKELLGHHT